MNFATIGTGWITDLFIESAIKTEMELVSVYSRSEGKARSFAQKHKAQHYFTHLPEMLADDDIDFIYIASPNSLHYEHILQCIDYEKHVFCEKPLVINEKQWQEVQQRAKSAGVFVCEGYRHLYTPNYSKLKQTLSQVGEIRSVLLPFAQYSSRYDAFKRGERPNVFTKDFAGGVLMDLGVYPLSMAIDLFDEPEDIHYYPVLLENGIDGSGTLIMDYGTFQVTILCSKITHSDAPSEIHGEAGTLKMDHMANMQSLQLFDRPNKKVIDLTQNTVAFDMRYELEAFKQMVGNQAYEKHDSWLNRSRKVAKWSEKARKSVGILFPGD